MTGRLPVMLVALLAAADLASPAGSDDPFASARHRMVARQLTDRGVADHRVLEAMDRVPRHRFVPEHLQREAYADHPLPIGHGQTISQPYIVAVMTEALRLRPTDRVLEIGTGSGYQAAVLAELAAEVYSVEIVAPLADRARSLLAELGYANVRVRTGDGYAGWPEAAPFDRIMVTAAPARVPQPLLDQLAPDGLLVVPEGEGVQTLALYHRRAEDGPDGRPIIDRRRLLTVRFVPMTGRAEQDR